MNKALLLFTLPVLTLASCNASLAESSGNISEPPAQSSVEPYASVEWDEDDYVSSKFSASGTFTDVNVGEPLLVGEEFIFSFAFNGSSVVDADIRFTQNGVAEISNVSDGSFTLKGLKEGEIILKIYDKDEYLHYRNRISFRNGKAQDELLEWAFEEVDHYESNFFKGANITFTGTHTLIYSGYDEDVPLVNPITFEIEYDHSSNIEHYYTVTTWNNVGNESTLNVVTIIIDRTGYFLHPMTRNGVVDFFTPVFN